MTRYWFKPKSFGYGATPATWQGWAATFGVIAVVLASVAVMALVADAAGGWLWLVWAAVVAAIILWFVRFTRNRTDGEWRWRWGKRA